jgi:DNA invertase Pin-like site-specific DNA recombinase
MEQKVITQSRPSDHKPRRQPTEPELTSESDRLYSRTVNSKRAVIHVRVNTSNQTDYGEHRTYDQDPEVQAEPLREMVRQRGWEFVRVYSDRISGTRERRPDLDQLMIDARRGKFDVVVVWRFDRFARSVKQLVMALEEFRSLGTDFVSHQEALDTSTPMGKAMFTIIATMAELERSVIRDRVVAGLKHACQHGTRSGRPVGRPRAVFDRAHAFKLRRAGWSWGRTARKLGTSVASVRRAYGSTPDPQQLCQKAPEEY